MLSFLKETVYIDIFACKSTVVYIPAEDFIEAVTGFFTHID